ncbi:Uncharacterised protein g1350 [Pycnogonum litorale]
MEFRHRLLFGGFILIVNSYLSEQIVIDKSRDLQASATDHGGDHYFQFAHVPAHKEYAFGFRKGNDYHFIERDEKGKDHTFKTKVIWGDKKGGYGEHYWDYNHAPKYGYGHDKRRR